MLKFKKPLDSVGRFGNYGYQAVVLNDTEQKKEDKEEEQQQERQDPNRSKPPEKS